MGATKTYLYKAYDSAGNFLAVWPDVFSEFSLTQEINGVGSNLAISLARPIDNFGEGSDVAHNNNVKVYCIDDDNPSGLLVFSGFISSYTPVVNENDEYILVNVSGYGAKLDTYMLEQLTPTNPAIDNSGAAQHKSNNQFGKTSFIAQSFYATGHAVTKVYAAIGWDFTGAPVPPASYGTLKCGIYSDSGGKPGTLVGSFVTVTGGIPSDINHGGGAYFDFSSAPPATTLGAKYWMVWKATDASDFAYVAYESLGDYDGANDQYISSDSGSTWYKYNAGGAAGNNNDVGYQIWDDSVDTTVPYLSYDPGAILRDIIDRYRYKGGELNYDTSTVELTGTTVSYTFNTNTIWEAMQQCISLAPVGWYLYIDQSTNMVHFHKRNTVPDITFVLGRDLAGLSPEKRIEDLINIIYFTGGGDPPLFAKFQDIASVAKYGPRVQRYVDQRVTILATATTIATSLLDQLKAGEVRFSFEVLDSTVDSNRGRDIESIQLGQMVGIRNVVNGRGAALYDVAYYDQDYYDFSMLDVSSTVVQIVRLERGPDTVTVYCSTVPPDVSKRIEDINRNLQATQTFNNPTTPNAGS